LHCPRCGHTDGKCVGGYELNLAYLEVEEHATCGVGPESAE
jgi:Zn finger protein HypA/HybF involved in hydrogenase expression